MVEKIEIKNAKEHFVNGEYRQAVRIYEQLLENNPNNVSHIKNESNCIK